MGRGGRLGGGRLGGGLLILESHFSVPLSAIEMVTSVIKTRPMFGRVAIMIKQARKPITRTAGILFRQTIKSWKFKQITIRSAPTRTHSPGTIVSSTEKADNQNPKLRKAVAVKPINIRIINASRIGRCVQVRLRGFHFSGG